MYKGSIIKTHFHTISESYALLFAWEYSFDLVCVGGGTFSPVEVCGGNIYIPLKTSVSITLHGTPFVRYSVYNQLKKKI